MRIGWCRDVAPAAFEWWRDAARLTRSHSNMSIESHPVYITGSGPHLSVEPGPERLSVTSNSDDVRHIQDMSRWRDCTNGTAPRRKRR
ncbi:hypothetical protein MES5069_1160008 [Mesorhizobium escarrei]|uniref:Uncharacterized protein n=1 Tax=Mesorhizobium escarrei TaxID=666018 RepID=A0ABN8JC73_9HYPH|nr:hypothetical protein MES5069_1160008 [Mesorhizobium escarrei]